MWQDLSTGGLHCRLVSGEVAVLCEIFTSAILDLFLWLVCCSKEESSDYCLRTMCLAATVLGIRQGKIGCGGDSQQFSISVFLISYFLVLFLTLYSSCVWFSFLFQIFPENKAPCVLPRFYISSCPLLSHRTLHF